MTFSSKIIITYSFYTVSILGYSWTNIDGAELIKKFKISKDFSDFPSINAILVKYVWFNNTFVTISLCILSIYSA